MEERTMLKKLIVILLTLMLLLGAFAGCTPEAEESHGDAMEKDHEPITISVNVMDAEKCGSNAKSDFIKEEFGVTFDYWPTTWGDWNEKLNVWINGGNAPDLIWSDLKGASSQQYRTWADQGAFAPVDLEMLSDYEYLDALAKEMANTSIKALTVGDELYAWPATRNDVPSAQHTYNSWWGYRRDWAKEVGLYKEGDVYTFEEWKTLVATVIAEDPGGNGAGNTAGLVMPTWAFPFGAVLFINDVPAEGNETCSYINVDGEYVWPPTTEEYREGVIATYEMYQEGLIWQDNISFKGGEETAMFKSGLAFAQYPCSIGDVNATMEELSKAGLTTADDAVAPVLITFDDKAWFTQTEDYWTVTSFSSEVDAEKMDRVFEVWNFLMSPEGMRLNLVGLEGVDYDLNDDGSMKVLWDIDPDTGQFVNPYAEIRFNEATMAGAPGPKNPSPATAAYGLAEIAKVRKYMADNEVGIKTFDYDTSFFSAPKKDQYGTFGIEVKNKLIELLVSSEDIGADWDAYVESMMPKVQPILDEINAEFAD